MIQDAIKAAVMTSRFTSSWDQINWKLCSTKEKADTSFRLLKKMFDMGADINSHDSYGNSCLHRAILDAKQILPSYDYRENKLKNDRLFNDEVKEDLTRIFDLLLEQGADIYEVDPRINRPFCEHYAREPVAKFFI